MCKVSGIVVRTLWDYSQAPNQNEHISSLRIDQQIMIGPGQYDMSVLHAKAQGKESTGLL